MDPKLAASPDLPENNTRSAIGLKRLMGRSMDLNGDVRKKADNMSQRLLSDEDIDALSDSLLQKFEDRLYMHLGKGLWAMFTKAFIGIVIAVAALGYVKGWWKP